MFKRLFASAESRRRISWTIAIVLIVPMVLFFNSTTQRAPEGGPGGAAGVIFGREVPWEDFEAQRLAIRRQMEMQMGEMPPAILPFLNRTTWDRLILLEEARRQNIRADDIELAARIQQIPSFQDGGRFVPQRYYQFLRMSGMGPQQFEDRMRQDLSIEKLMEGIKRSVTVTDEDVLAAYRTARERLQASAVVIESSAFADQAAAGLTDDLLKAHYGMRPELVRVPEQVKIEVATRTREEAAAGLELTDEEIRAYYDERPEDFPGEGGAPKPFDEVKDEARTRARDARVRKRLTDISLDLQDDLDAKLPWDAIVASRQLTVKAAGPLALGNLFAPGAPEPAVMQAIGRTSGPEITEVVETDQGVSIARVVDRIPSRIPPLDEVRDTVKQDWIAQESRRLARAAADAFRQKVLGPPPLRFEEAAAAESRPVKAVEFTRSGPIEALGPSAGGVNQAAFATPVGQVTEVFELPQGFAILRPDALVPADEAGFPQEQERLRQETLARKQDERQSAFLNEVRERAALKSFVDEPASELPFAPPAAPPAPAGR